MIEENNILLFRTAFSHTYSPNNHHIIILSYRILIIDTCFLSLRYNMHTTLLYCRACDAYYNILLQYLHYTRIERKFIS